MSQTNLKHASGGVLPSLSDCETCTGTGRRKAGDRKPCERCHGTGRRQAGPIAATLEVGYACDQCSGTGGPFGRGCQKCKGSGAAEPDRCADCGPNRCLCEGLIKEEETARVSETNPKTQAGSRKAPMRFIPPTAFIAEARVFELGATKYGDFNWRRARVPASIYYEAALRHMFAWYDGQDYDEESGVSHLAHIRACMAILIDAELKGTLIDDRPTTGASAGFLASLVQAET